MDGLTCLGIKPGRLCRQSLEKRFAGPLWQTTPVLKDQKAHTDLLNLLTSISIHLQLAKSHLIPPLLQAPANVIHASILVLQERPHVEPLQLLPKTGAPDEAVLLVIVFAFADAITSAAAATAGG